MTIKEIIQKLHTTITDSRGQESHFESWLTLNDGIIDAIDALKALDKQEPVAWMFQHDETGRMNYVSNDGIHDPTMFLGMNPRYALVCPLYTTPPQRKTLTDEEMKKIWYAMQNIMGWYSFQEIARAIEAAHGIKEKNT